MNIMDQEPKNTQLELSVIGVRCPKCLKLYAVEKADIRESKPKFQCSKCQTRFWFPYPTGSNMAEIIGFPVSWLEDDDVNKEAPKKEEEPVVNAAVVAATVPPPFPSEVTLEIEAATKSFKMQQDVGVPHSKRLRDMWNHVVENYSNENLHQQFVKMCQKENNLAFASKKYAHILNMVSDDEIAVKMQREIDSLIQIWMARSQKQKKPVLRNRIVWLGVGLGIVLVCLGLSFYQLRNLVGIGAVLSFLTLALQGFIPTKK